MKSRYRAVIIFSGLIVLTGMGVIVATQMNDRTESSAKKSYIFKTYLMNDNIKIQTSGKGVVTLTGSVAEWSHKSLAEETVSGLPGVKSVDNKLEMKTVQPPENSDLWIRMKIKTMLLFHNNVSSVNTDVDVKDGIVTIAGKAESEAQKDLTFEYALDVDGVKSVINNLIVEKPDKSPVEKINDFIDDASITTQVKLALTFHRSTSVIKTNVETKDGVVTVSGIAKNSAEKDLVSKLVNDIKGVKSLKNQMTVG